MIQTRAIHRLKANLGTFGQATLPGSTSAYDQSDVIAKADDALSGADLTGDNNPPGGDFKVPTEASANNPVIAPEQEFKPWNPNPDSNDTNIEARVVIRSRAVDRIKANVMGV